MDFNKITYTTVSSHYLQSHQLWRTHSTVCVQCLSLWHQTLFTSHYIQYVVIDNASSSSVLA